MGVNSRYTIDGHCHVYSYEEIHGMVEIMDSLGHAMANVACLPPVGENRIYIRNNPLAFLFKAM